MSMTFRKDPKALTIDDVTELIGTLKKFHDRLAYRSEVDLDIQMYRYFPDMWSDYVYDDGLWEVMKECTKDFSNQIRSETNIVSFAELESDFDDLINKLMLFISYVPDRQKINEIISKRDEEIKAVISARNEEEKKNKSHYNPYRLDDVDDLDRSGNSDNDPVDDAFNPYYLPDELSGRKMTYYERKRLLNGEELWITDFVSGAGDRYSAYVSLDKDKKYLLRFV